MVFINSEGKFNDNTYLIDGLYMGMKGTLALYIIENNGKRMLIDTSTSNAFRKVYRKLEELKLLPIHKLFLTHAHADHVEATSRFRKKNPELEVYASIPAVENLKHPERMNEVLGEPCKPVLDVIPLDEGNLIDLNGLKLRVYNFFGHTQDSIALLDEKNKNIFVGDTILDKYDPNSFNPTFFPPDFNEDALLDTFKKLRNLKDKLNSICLAHYGAWTGEDFFQILNDMEPIHVKTRNAFMEWHKQDLSLDEITLNYRNEFIPNSSFFKVEQLYGLRVIINWLITGLKMAGIIKE
ncbi:MAG: MBL fold metallo-hydrolase [Candidatus Hodarchaeota archaeon]